MDEKKPRLPIETDAEMNAHIAAARKAEGHLTVREMIQRDIEADLLAEENLDEFARIRAEDVARGKAVEQTRRDRAQREKVLTEKRRRDAADRALKPLDPAKYDFTTAHRYWAQPRDPAVASGSSVLDEIRKNPEFKYQPIHQDQPFDVDAWIHEDWKPQIALWESQFKPNGLSIGPFPKYDLFLWAVQHLLPIIGKKAPTVWQVYCYLLLVSPEDFSGFGLSNRRLAEGSGVSRQSVHGAIGYLRELKLIAAKMGMWSPAGPKAAVLPRYSLTTLEELKKLYSNGPIDRPFIPTAQ
jgi:hypothetical protein